MFVIKRKPFLLSLFVPLAIGALVGFIIMPNIGIYRQFALPPGAPPSWLFPIAWSLLYLMMGLAFYGVFSAQAYHRTAAFWVYALQLAFNFLWPIFFFKAQLYLFSFVWLLALLVLIVLTIRLFYPINRLSAYLMLPYLAWCLYAAYLNFGVAVLN